MQGKRKEQVFLVIALCLAIFSPNYSQFQMSPISTQIMAAYNISMPQFVSLFTAPMLTAIFLSVISGSIVDRFGYKWIIFISLAISLLGTISRLFVTSYAAFFISMICIGFSATFINANLAKILGMWFDRSRFQMLLGVVLAVSTIGMTVALGTTALFESTEVAFKFSAAINALALILWPVLVTEKNEPGKSDRDMRLSGMMIHVLKHKPIWYVGLSLFCVMGGYMTLSSFLPMIMIAKGISNEAAGVMSSFLTFGNLLGCLFVPMFITKINNRRVSIVILVVGVTSMCLIFSRVTSTVLMSLILILMGIVVGGLMPTFMSLPVMFPKIGQSYSGTAGGIIGMLQLMGAAIIPSYLIAPLELTANHLFYTVGFVFVIVIATTWKIPFSEVE